MYNKYKYKYQKRENLRSLYEVKPNLTLFHIRDRKPQEDSSSKVGGLTLSGTAGSWSQVMWGHFEW